jgi:hypothetical protein
LLVDSNCKAIGLNYIQNQSVVPVSQDKDKNLQVLDKYHSSSWYKDIVYFLQNFQCPLDFDKSKRRSLKLKVVKYSIINQNLFWKDPNGILLRCIDEDESNFIMTDLHKGVCGGHQHWKSTAFKILRLGTTGPLYFLMCLLKLEHVSSVKSLLENNNYVLFP